MAEIIYSDEDIVDVNINVAKNFLIRAYSVSERKRKIKSLILAMKSIENSLISLGVNIEKLKIKKSAKKEMADDK